MASEAARVPAPDTARSLKRWWEDGGEAWLASYLELPRFGSIEAPKRHVVVPPDARQTLHLGAGPESLRPLLCPLGDAACGADTRGWRARAETFLEDHRLSGWSREAKGLFADRSDAAARDCDEKAAADKSPGRYRRWRSCIDGRRETRWALPLGDMKAPDTGWLLVSGRRGHYDFCDAIGGYDLVTGTAYVRESCSGLALVEGGHVDEAATARSARSRGRVGRLRIENLREVVWALLMMTRAEELQTNGEYYPLPPGLRDERWPPGRRDVGLVVDHDGEDTPGLAVDSRQSRAGGGELTWPNSANGVEEHAARLLDIAETSFVEACPAVPPPPVESLPDRGAETPPPFKELVEGFRAWRAAPPCGIAKPGVVPR